MSATVQAVVIETEALGRGSRARIALNTPPSAAADHRDVTVAWAARLRGWITRVAWLRARNHEALQPDLEQMAYVRLVEIDPTRLTANDEPWVKKQLGHAIKRALVGELRHDGPRGAGVPPDQVSQEDIAEPSASIMEARRFRKNRQRRVAKTRPA